MIEKGMIGIGGKPMDSNWGHPDDLSEFHLVELAIHQTILTTKKLTYALHTILMKMSESTLEKFTIPL